MPNDALNGLAHAVQRNCHIADARHGADYTMCVYLMKMREYYRWEKGLGYDARLPNEEVGDWLMKREELWDSLSEAEFAPLRITDAQVVRLEEEIDAMNAGLEPLRSFILPGGTALAAHLHLCRTVARRAERHAVELAGAEGVNPAAVRFLNRLSDWFFVAGRVVNDNGRGDVLWVPGANR